MQELLLLDIHVPQQLRGAHMHAEHALFIVTCHDYDRQKSLGTYPFMEDNHLLQQLRECLLFADMHFVRGRGRLAVFTHALSKGGRD